MRPLRALVIYIAVVFIGGALLAPWLWHLMQSVAGSFPKIAHEPFHRYLDRSFLILALAGLWPLLRSLGATSWREAGLVPPYGQMKKLGGGLLLGTLSLALVAGIALAFGARTAVHPVTAHQLGKGVASAVATAVVVAVMEEILFRGGIFGGLRRVLYWPFALVISSVVYALVHFLQTAELAGPVHWDSGLVLLPRILAGFADFRTLVPGFFSLTLAGVLLGLAYQRSGNLYFSMGLHGGWIFCLKLYGHFTAQAPQSTVWFWGSSKMTDGWLAFIVLAVLLTVFPRLPLDERHTHYTISS